ncbi:MAG: SPFH domain-containing protein [Candidatus Brocadiia bacterium]
MREEQNNEEHREESEEGTPEPVGHRALSDALRLSFGAVKVAMAILIVLYLLQGFFFVDSDEVKIKLRFGRPVQMSLGQGRGKGYVADSRSGWHYAWPWEEVVTVPLSERSIDLTETFSPPDIASGPSGEQEGLNPKTDSYLLTGDVNIIYLQLRARYRARSDEQGALDYAFRTKPRGDGSDGAPPPEQVLRRIITTATLETVASWGVLDVRRKTREIEAPSGEGTVTIQLFEQIEQNVRQRLAEYEENSGFTTGVELRSIERIEDPEVPRTVRPAFDRYMEAESEKQRMIDEARREANRITANAEGEYAENLAQARSYKKRLISMGEADSTMLKNLTRVYRESPEKASILREWHYQRMIEDLLRETAGSFVLHKPAEGTERELWLQLGQPKSGESENEDEDENENENEDEE